ncbi:nicotinamide mononucleotide transporter [Thermodesulfobacteriota bacterium]
MFEWFLTGLSLLGTWFNLEKKVAGWYVWSLANVGWVVSFSVKGMVAEATLFGIYLILSIYGIFKWSASEKKKARRKEDHEKAEVCVKIDGGAPID